MPEETTMKYLFARSEQSIFSEIYFPKRAAYYGTIFNALRYGYDESHVRGKLVDQVGTLLNEFKSYPALFDPHEYTRVKRVKTPVSIEDARERIQMYKSPFKGWSVYSVDGVFFNSDNGEMQEEAVQVVRIMFRFESCFAEMAVDARCGDVFRCLLFWLIARQGRLDNHKMWSKGEEHLFLSSQPPFPKRKRLFVERHFGDIAKEVNKWIDDRALFIFAYLVKQFADKVLVEQLYEKEIWVTNLFDQNLNVVRRIESVATTT